MTFVRIVLRKLHRLPMIFQTRWRIFRLYVLANIAAKSIARALKDTLDRRTTQEEKLWIDKIESLRSKLNSSSREIPIVDYGAGSPDVGLTKDEMYQGRRLTTTIGDVCQTSSKSQFWAFFLFRLLRELRPSVCLELGTCLGISASYQAAALKLNQAGKIVTLEGSESLSSLAKQHFQTLGLDNVTVVVGRFQDTLSRTLHEHGNIDYALVDGHHDEEATLAYFEEILPALSEKAVLVFDDIAWSEGMKKAWNAIESDNRVRVSVDLSTLGLCIIDSTIKRKQCFQIHVI